MDSAEEPRGRTQRSDVSTSRSLAPAAQRAAGVFYTPTELAGAILDRLLLRMPLASERPVVLDPSCGEGVFLAGIARRLPQARLLGIDQDALALQVARARVEGLSTLAGDALDPALGPADGSVDAVVGNPPFVRCRVLPSPIRQELRSHYETARGAFNLAVPFVERCLRWLKPGGRLALVLPNKLLVAGYAARLRELLCREATLEEILDLSDLEPFDAAAYPIVLLATRRRPDAGHRVRLVEARLEAGDGPGQGWRELASRLVPQLPDGLASPARSDPWVEEVLGRSLPQLGEVFRLREGLHTGNARRRLLLDSPCRASDRPVLRGRDCGRYVLRWAGLWVATDPALLEREHGEYATFPPAEVFSGPKLLLREISLRPAACLDPADHWTLNKVYPLQEHRRLDEEQRFACLGLLNSAPLLRLYQGMFRATHLRGGYLQFKARYVHRLPLPQLDVLVRRGLGRLARRRHELGARPGPERDRLEQEIDRLVESIYAER